MSRTNSQQWAAFEKFYIPKGQFHFHIKLNSPTNFNVDSEYQVSPKSVRYFENGHGLLAGCLVRQPADFIRGCSTTVSTQSP